MKCKGKIKDFEIVRALGRCGDDAIVSKMTEYTAIARNSQHLITSSFSGVLCHYLQSYECFKLTIGCVIIRFTLGAILHCLFFSSQRLQARFSM